MTRNKEADIILKCCQVFDGNDTVSHWASESVIRLVYNSRQLGQGNNFYVRIEDHAKSIGMNVDLSYKYPCKLSVVISIKP